MAVTNLKKCNTNKAKQMTTKITYTLKIIALLIINVCVLQTAEGKAYKHVVVTDSCINDSSIVTLPDSTVRRMAHKLGMIDSAGISNKLHKLEKIEKDFSTLIDTATWNRTTEKYRKRKEKSYLRWMRLVPKQFSIQYAGSIGLMSGGFGWAYGKNKHWETDLMVGFLPRYHSDHAHSTFTIKERYVVWHCKISSRWTIQPLTTGLFFNTISGEAFWRKEPDKYPKRYYGFSTKIRSNIFIGQRVKYNIPSRHRVFHSAISAYYEISTCDLYLASKFTNKEYPWSKTLSLALGIKWDL